MMKLKNCKSKGFRPGKVPREVLKDNLEKLFLVKF